MSDLSYLEIAIAFLSGAVLSGSMCATAYLIVKFWRAAGFPPEVKDSDLEGK